jgi:hypothetical protein
MRICSATIKFILIIQCILSLSFAQHPGDEMVTEGVDAFFNYEFEKSIEVLSKAREE